jgi:hypothetical protein
MQSTPDFRVLLTDQTGRGRNPETGRNYCMSNKKVGELLVFN